MVTPRQALTTPETPETRRRDAGRERWRQVHEAIRCSWGRTGYRSWARLLHAANLHHTRPIPMDDGTVAIRCDWCGLHGSRGLKGLGHV